MNDCHSSGNKLDILFWGSLIALTLAVIISLGNITLPYVTPMADDTTSLLKQAWWGIAMGVWSVGFLSSLSKDAIFFLLGTPQKPIAGIFRAVCAGVVLDVCSHGVLMIGAQLYKKGITKAQLIAFLVATPWNSFALLMILGSLQGFFWTLIFLLLSLVIAFNAGLAIHWIEKRNSSFFAKEKEKIISTPPKLADFWASLRESLRIKNVLWNSWGRGIREGRPVLRWLFLGLLLAAAVRTFVPPNLFQEWLAPTLLGLLMTLVLATILEVCSEGSAPIAADITTRAQAPGNAFTFLMAGVATDVTEATVLRQITGRWVLSGILPILVLFQTLPLSILINNMN